MSHVLDDFALTIAQSEFRARPDFVPFEGSPSTEDFCIAALAAALRALREERDALREQMAELETCLLEDAFRELGMEGGLP